MEQLKNMKQIIPLITMTITLLVLTSCAGSKTLIVLHRNDKPSEDVLGTIRPAERINANFSVYNGKDNVTGKIKGGVGPEYILQFESDWLKQNRTLQEYMRFKKKLKEMVESGELSKDRYEDLMKSVVEPTQ